MADPEQLAILKQGAAVWNAWRQEHPDWTVDRGTDFFRADLFGADLSRWADPAFSGVNGEADLSGTNLTETDLSYADLRGADLSRADLRRAGLTMANLSEADLNEADLSRTLLYETVFANVDLTSTKGLDNCEHRGPSILDYRTLAKSGKLPSPSSAVLACPSV